MRLTRGVTAEVTAAWHGQTHSQMPISLEPISSFKRFYPPAQTEMPGCNWIDQQPIRATQGLIQL